MLYGSWNRGIASHLCLICFVTKRTDLFKTRLRLWYKLYVSKTLEGGPTAHIILSIWSLWTFSGFQGTLGYLRQHGVWLKGRNGMLKKSRLHGKLFRTWEQRLRTNSSSNFHLTSPMSFFSFHSLCFSCLPLSQVLVVPLDFPPD